MRAEHPGRAAASSSTGRMTSIIRRTTLAAAAYESRNAARRGPIAGSRARSVSGNGDKPTDHGALARRGARGAGCRAGPARRRVPPDLAAPRPFPGRAGRAVGVASPVVLWAGLVLAGHLLAARLVEDDYRVHIGAPPLVGSFDPRLSWSLGGALAARRRRGRVRPRARRAAALALAGRARRGSPAPRGSSRSRSAPAAAAEALWAPLQTRYEYLAAVPRVGDAQHFLQGFAHALPSYPTHVRGHPPGMVLRAVAARRSSALGGPRWAAALIIGGGRSRRAGGAWSRCGRSRASARPAARRCSSHSVPRRSGSGRRPTRCSARRSPSGSRCSPSRAPRRPRRAPRRTVRRAPRRAARRATRRTAARASPRPCRLRAGLTRSQSSPGSCSGAASC